MQQAFGKGVQMCNFSVALVRQLIDGQKSLVGMKAKLFFVIVREIIGIAFITDNKKLHKAK